MFRKPGSSNTKSNNIVYTSSVEQDQTTVRAVQSSISTVGLLEIQHQIVDFINITLPSIITENVCMMIA